MYVYRERIEPGDIFAAIMTFLVIAFILIMLVVYVSVWILVAFLGVGVLIAAVYSLIVYGKALGVAWGQVGGFSGVATVPELLLRWVELFKTTSAIAFRENWTVAQNALAKGHTYKFLSFRRWMWVIVAPSVLVMGTLVIVGIVLLQVALLAAAIVCVLGLVAAYILAMLVGACGYGLFLDGCTFGQEVSSDPATVFPFNFTLSACFSDYLSALTSFFPSLWAIAVRIFEECLAQGQSNWNAASGYMIIAPQRLFLMASLVAFPAMAVLFDALMLLLGAVAYVVLAVANILWTLIAMLVGVIRR